VLNLSQNSWQQNCHCATTPNVAATNCATELFANQSSDFVLEYVARPATCNRNPINRFVQQKSGVFMSLMIQML